MVARSTRITTDKHGNKPTGFRRELLATIEWLDELGVHAERSPLATMWILTPFVANKTATGGRMA